MGIAAKCMLRSGGAPGVINQSGFAVNSIRLGYWRRRATETRALAQEITDVHTKILSLGVAEIYEQIPKAFEKRVKRKDALSRPE